MRPAPRSILASLILLASAGLAPTSSALAAETRAFVACTDFSTGCLSAVALGNHAVSSCAASIHSDATLRWANGLVYVVNRFGQDNIQVIDPSNGYATVKQFSTGNGSNPQDIVVVSATRAYVSRYGSNSVLIVNPTSGAGLGSISLAPFADSDGIPEMARMIRVGPRLFVACQRLTSFQPSNPSVVVAIDLAADTVLDADPALPGTQAIALAGRNPVTTFAFDPETSRLLIGCAGSFGALDGGIEWIDPVGLASRGYAITESALGGDIGDLVWNGPAHSYAIVSDASFVSKLKSWSATSGTVLGTLHDSGGFNLPDMEMNDRGELYVADNNFVAPGIRIYSTASDQLLAGPIDVGLPPNQITFDQASDLVTGVPAIGLAPALRGPWPNPARAAARLILELPRGTDVDLGVFDLAGRRIRTLARGAQPAGPLERSWDLRSEAGARVSPGVYLLRARAGGGTTTRRVIVLE